MLGKKRKLGRKFSEIQVGEKLQLTEKIEDKDLLLYLGLTNDSNPLYIQHDYASQTDFGKPIVPSIMLTGIITSAISKYLPGPGSHLTEQQITFVKPVYHYETIQYHFEVKEKIDSTKKVIIQVHANNQGGDQILHGEFVVIPPVPVKQFTGTALDNF
ncbi:MaoC/PaaZ C-terminal domain-containing protein [Mangrovibacillus cuniculi]|uniref:Enoyl-CoA hydratase n=1 Tax=Mangrovibacillus cuniculi TaxID=2593652 RepID=A0A7S8CC93_9BACI|nr:MaoC/PaaZ C-terminal domain-containing protein [Mangrovibacillus cuniculi]QPC47201.1 enoyl-CoA hydratase [Mangrovibacillus cuniculi]